MFQINKNHFFFIAFIFSSFYGFTQESSNLIGEAEKIYLHTDKEIYERNSTIWFSAFIVQAENHKPSSLSQILRVQLVNAENKVIDNKLIEIKDGMAEGFFDINENDEGFYWLMAYTEWNRNFSREFDFKKKLLIYDANSGNSDDIFKNIKINKTFDGKQQLAFDIYAKRLDSIHSGKLKVRLKLNDKIEKQVSLKKLDSVDFYSLNYDLTDADTLVSVSVKTKKKNKVNKHIQLINTIDVQFFPEGGNLINGIESRVGFKALDINGKGIKVDGEVFDNFGNSITEFSSNNLGMGSFTLLKPDSNKKYFAKIKNKTYSLPKVKLRGTNLKVTQDDNQVKFKIQTNFLVKEKVDVHISSRGTKLMSKQLLFDDQMLTIDLDKNIFNDGIHIVSLVDTSGNTILERLFFVENKIKRINLNIFSDYSYYGKRQKTRLKIKPIFNKKSKHFFKATIKVILKDDLGDNFYNANTLLSYLLLDSDLKGHIEDPGFYFSKGTPKDLDDLLLTQGWSNYNYTQKINQITFKPEKNISVSGFVSHFKNNKKAETKDLILLPYFKSKKTKIFFSKANVPGNFKFNLGKLSGDEVRVYIQETERKKKNLLQFQLNKYEWLEPKFTNIDKNRLAKPEVNEVVIKSKDRVVKNREIMFLKQGTVVLDEVIVKSKLNIPKRDEMIDKYGYPSVEIAGEEIVEKKKKWSSGALQVLRFNFYDKITVVRDLPNYGLSVKAVGGLREQNFVAVDGIFVKRDDYKLIEYIASEEVVRFEVVEDLKTPAFRRAFIQTYGRPPKMGPFDGNLICIYTKSGKGIYHALKSDKVKNTFKIPVLSSKREYYTPKYDYKMTEEDWANLDTRTLLFWKPNIDLDNKSFKEFSYYNSDVEGEVLVIVEVIDENGNLGYQTLSYSLDNSRN